MGNGQSCIREVTEEVSSDQDRRVRIFDEQDVEITRIIKSDNLAAFKRIISASTPDDKPRILRCACQMSHWVIDYDDVTFVEYLLDAGCPPSAEFPDPSACRYVDMLLRSLESKSSATTMMLLARKTPISEYAWQAAICHGSVEIIKTMLNQGADKSLLYYFIEYSGRAFLAPHFMRAGLEIPSSLVDPGYDYADIYRESRSPPHAVRMTKLVPYYNIQETARLLYLAREFLPRSLVSKDSLPKDLFDLILCHYKEEELCARAHK